MGKLFVIEGLDGSGKETQTGLVVKRLKEEGYDVRSASFPNYKSESSALVKMYLNGDFGSNPDDVEPKVASVFYAVDRYATFRKEYEDFYENGGIIIADRYVTSNMVHQACKIESPEERMAYIDWLVDFEYKTMKIPSPDRTFFLDISPEVSGKLIENRNNKFTDSRAKDIHEKNRAYLEKAYANVDFLVKNCGFERIECVRDGKLKSIDEINEMLHERIVEELKNV